MLDVEYANLSTLPSSLNLKTIQTLKLGGNPWNCTCWVAEVKSNHIDFGKGSISPRLILFTSCVCHFSNLKLNLIDMMVQWYLMLFLAKQNIQSLKIATGEPTFFFFVICCFVMVVCLQR